MTRDDADRLEGVRDLISEAISELEMTDDKALGWEPMVMLCAIQRYVDKVMTAETELTQLAPVIEFTPRAGGETSPKRGREPREQSVEEFMASEFGVSR